MIYHEGFYYWYGENKAGPTYTAYSVACVPIFYFCLGQQLRRAFD